MVLVVLLF